MVLERLLNRVHFFRFRELCRKKAGGCICFQLRVISEIGLGLTGFGIFFSFLGIIFFFDKGLLAMGNILFFSGVTLTIGLKSSMQFFMKRSNFKVYFVG
ncbi:hypothetical protein F0562_007962 [Nyssa sinensis]|uniref:Vesicle transport protein n=1 Tax=Nyssa sinensis TaxID=561372 RepID=A0A5J5A7D4_9ASTE|nr:hypothetical protein F0562_007962 [Nyssa sinensis]